MYAGANMGHPSREKDLVVGFGGNGAMNFRSLRGLPGLTLNNVMVGPPDFMQSNAGQESLLQALLPVTSVKQ